MPQRKTISFEDAVPLRVKPFTRVAQYYETDQMRIIHHAAYVHWMEEARVDVMEQIGFGYEKMEGMGIYCPVLGVSTEYHSMVRFYEKVLIECRVAEYTGLKLILKYRMTDLATGKVCTTGETRHGFLDAEGNIVSLKRKYPEIHQLILDALETV